MTHVFGSRGLSGTERVVALGITVAMLSGCTALGSAMSPYSEKFSCKNDDHGQCIHPEKAYEDAAQGRISRSDPAVTRDKELLRGVKPFAHSSAGRRRSRSSNVDAYGAYRDSVYRELQGLIDAPETPMLRPSRSVRTLILPYADRNRPDRLYMPRFVYSVLDTPSWVVGGYLLPPASQASGMPVLEQVREAPSSDPAPRTLEPRP